MFQRKASKNGYEGFWARHRLSYLFVLATVLLFLRGAEAIEVQGERVFGLNALRLVRENIRAGKRIALTFDDAPNGYTREILAVLERFKIRATFFLVGSQVLRHPGLVRLIVAAGHEIGNHSFSHALTKECLEKEIREDIERAERAILEVTGQLPLYFRPPGGLVTQDVQRACGALGYTLVLWSVDSGDWKAKDEEEVVVSVLQRVHPGAIVLFHPLPCTVRALPQVLQALEEKGYEIVPLSLLLWP